MRLTTELCELIPHAGTMCLLAGVVDWNNETISCLASSHRNQDNPLRRDQQLPAISAVEYAAQAMAVHGGLLNADQAAPRLGYLAALRQVHLHVERLDTLAADLEIVAKRLGGDSTAFLYEFVVTAEGKPVADGRAFVVHTTGEEE